MVMAITMTALLRGSPANLVAGMADTATSSGVQPGKRHLRAIISELYQ
jgi:hypothetical protein